MSRHHRGLLAVAITAVALDAGTKLAALRWLREPVDLGVVRLRVAYNTGVAFSFGADQPRALVLALTGLAVLALAVAAWRDHLGGPIPAGLIVGGGLANLIDRTTGGSVVDLVDPGWFAVFNLADVFITTGVVLLFLTMATDDSTQSDAAEEEASADVARQR
ncbi:MAG: signal peptidase II [Actinomycetota bacterium]|uniref:signal peptidase II n=1 Tax=Euzebya pacifica TaxID=1608957 RepID=UPI0030F8C95A